MAAAEVPADPLPAVAAAPPEDSVIGTFAVQDRMRDLLVAEGIPLTIDDPVADASTLLFEGYLPSHGWVTFKGEGLAFGQPPDTQEFTAAKPKVLLYAPRNKSLTDAQLSDMVPDAPYDLVGLAWFKDYEGSTPITGTPPEPAPSIWWDRDNTALGKVPVPAGLLPSGGWFRHAGGCHMSNGEFVAFDQIVPDVPTGLAMCAAIGFRSTWQADPGGPGYTYPGQPGKCVINRASTAIAPELPRPVMAGSYVTASAPIGWLAPPDRPTRPATVDPPDPDSPLFDQIAQAFLYAGYLIELAAYDYAMSWINDIESTFKGAADLRCGLIGAEIVPGNGPTFYHDMAWDTHVFWRPDGTSTVGVADYTLVPRGYTGPSIAFLPNPAPPNDLHILDRLPTPPAPRNLTANAGNARVNLDWDAPLDAAGKEVHLSEYQLTVTPAIPGSPFSIDPSQTNREVAGLQNGTAYRFSLVARNGGGSSTAATAGPLTPSTGAPNVTMRVTGGLPTGAKGWTNTATVDLEFTATDPQTVRKVHIAAAGAETWSVSVDQCTSFFGALTCPTQVTTGRRISTDGITTVTYWAEDFNGTPSGIGTYVVKLDRIAPLARFRTVARTGWQPGPYPFPWVAADDLSGQPGTDATVWTDVANVTGDGAGKTVTVTVSDDAGNTTQITSSAVDVDSTKPVVGVTGTPATAWVNRPVTLQFTPSDNLSDVGFASRVWSAANPYSGTYRDIRTVTVNDDGEWGVEYGAIDRARNELGKITIPIKIDKVAPTLGGSLTRATANAVPGATTDVLRPNAAGWITEKARYDWAQADDRSGIAGKIAPSPVPDGVGVSFTATAQDRAGNTRTVTSPTYNVDTVAPAVSSEAITNGFRLSATDATSGVEGIYSSLDGGPAQRGTGTVQITSTDPGTHTIVAYALDNAGKRSADVTLTFTIGAPPKPKPSLVPARLLETRPGQNTVDGVSAGIGRRPAGSVTEVVVAGRGGVPADATAVMLNVTAVAPSAGGFVTVFPCGSPRPLASNLNPTEGQVVPNAVLAKIGDGGKVCLYSVAATDLIVDVNGYSPADT